MYSSTPNLKLDLVQKGVLGFTDRLFERHHWENPHFFTKHPSSVNDGIPAERISDQRLNLSSFPTAVICKHSTRISSQ